jgi:DNA-binding MarR family transcriptional regulator
MHDSRDHRRRVHELARAPLDDSAMFSDARRVATKTRRLARVPAVELAQGLEETIVLMLFDLANHLQRRGERLAAGAGMTTQQWLVLLQIAGDPNFAASRARSTAAPVLPSDIARERGLSRATISAVVKALQHDGLIREERDPEDGRRKQLVVTPRGARALAAIEPARRDANRRLLAELDADDRRRLHGYLDRCLAVLWAAYEDDQLTIARARAERSR